MKIIFHKNFDKRYLKLSPKYKKKVTETILRFRGDPHHPILKNHPLKGSLVGKRAISATGDLRIIFEEHQNYTLVLMLDVGTHNQVY